MPSQEQHQTSVLGRVQVSNPDGIHVRPAMAITKLCVALQDHAGISILVSAAGHGDSFVDVASDFHLAQRGFGIAYTSLTKLAPENHSEPVIKVSGAADDPRKQRMAFALVKQLFADARTLETGGNGEEFNIYLSRAGVPILTTAP